MEPKSADKVEQQHQAESQEPTSPARQFDQDTQIKDEAYLADANTYMINQVRERHGSKETDIVLNIVKQYDLGNFSADLQQKMADEVREGLEPLGMTNEHQRADLISLVSSYVIIQNLKKQ